MYYPAHDGGSLYYRALGHGELMGKMQSLIERVRKSSEYLHLEETALDNVRATGNNVAYI